MKIQNILPTLYQLHYFKYIAKEGKDSISFEKSQYIYRILMIEKGHLSVCINGRTEQIQTGDVMYLLPGDIYSLFPCGSDFSLYNMSFYFTDGCDMNDLRNKSCVFLCDYEPSLCLPVIDFEDAPLLNEGGVFRSVYDGKSIRELCLLNKSDSLYSFYCRSALFGIIGEMLNSSKGQESNDSVTKQIIEYIRHNPEKNLSGESLSSLFSYHKNYINRLIKSETGKNMSDFIRYVKIEYAKALISEENCSLSELSSRLGYYDYSHFYKAFISETGISPKVYLSLQR